MPSTAEVEKDGLDVGLTQAALLKKIEELTLYVIPPFFGKNKFLG